MYLNMQCLKEITFLTARHYRNIMSIFIRRNIMLLRKLKVQFTAPDDVNRNCVTNWGLKEVGI